jgi:hypothetical protein
VDDVKFEDFERLAKSHEELSAHVIALTAVVGAMVTTSTVDFERLEECVHFAAKQLRPGRRPILFAKASLILEDFEGMQKALRVEVRKIRALDKRASKR